MGKCDTLYVTEIKFVLLQTEIFANNFRQIFFKFEQIYYYYILDTTRIVHYCYPKLSLMI